MQQAILADRYAHAYLNIYTQCTREQIKLIEQLVYYMRTHKKALFYLKLSCIKTAVKISILSNLFVRYGLSDILDKLLGVLAEHKRLFIIVDVLNSIIRVYKKRHGIMEWTIKTATVVQPENLESVYRFIEKKTGMRAEYTYKTDPTLIAGIRMQSNTLLWEYSIAQQLKRIAA